MSSACLNLIVRSRTGKRVSGKNRGIYVRELRLKTFPAKRSSLANRPQSRERSGKTVGPAQPRSVGVSWSGRAPLKFTLAPSRPLPDSKYNYLDKFIEIHVL